MANAIKCPKHPNYKGYRRAKSCSVCQSIFDSLHQPKPECKHPIKDARWLSDGTSEDISFSLYFCKACGHPYKRKKLEF